MRKAHKQGKEGHEGKKSAASNTVGYLTYIRVSPSNMLAESDRRIEHKVFRRYAVGTEGSKVRSRVGKVDVDRFILMALYVDGDLFSPAIEVGKAKDLEEGATFLRSPPAGTLYARTGCCKRVGHAEPIRQTGPITY